MCRNQTKESNKEINKMIINSGQDLSLLGFWPLLMGSEQLCSVGRNQYPLGDRVNLFFQMLYFAQYLKFEAEETTVSFS